MSWMVWLQLTDGSTLTMYADDILLSKPISCPEDYGGLQSDINTFHDCISASHLILNPSKCKYLICSKKRHPYLPSAGLQLDGIALEQVNSYCYLGEVVSSKLTWSEHIEQVCSKARKLVGMLYRQFYSWADIPILLLIIPHLHPSTPGICMSTLGPFNEQEQKPTGRSLHAEFA